MAGVQHTHANGRCRGCGRRCWLGKHEDNPERLCPDCRDGDREESAAEVAVDEAEDRDQGRPWAPRRNG